MNGYAMTLDDVRQRVAHVAGLAGDDEAAHAAEDALWKDVLAAIATGNVWPSAQALARTALGTVGLEFCRWYA